MQSVKCLPKTLFSIDIMDIYLLPPFCIRFKTRLESVTLVFMYEAVREDLKMSESIEVNAGYHIIAEIWDYEI